MEEHETGQDDLIYYLHYMQYFKNSCIIHYLNKMIFKVILQIENPSIDEWLRREVAGERSVWVLFLSLL